MLKRTNELSLTQREMDVMTILWKSETPLVASEIANSNSSLNINTVQAVIRKLLNKKYIVVADIVYSGTVLTRSYKPAISKKEMAFQQFTRNLREENENISIPNLVTTLLKHEKNEKKVIEELEKLLEERKKLLEQEEK